MKKWLAVIVAVIGIILAGFGISTKMKGAASIGIIGGADGPTAIFVGGGFGFWIMLFGIIMVVAGIFIYRKIKNK